MPPAAVVCLASSTSGGDNIIQRVSQDVEAGKGRGHAGTRSEKATQEEVSFPQLANKEGFRRDDGSPRQAAVGYESSGRGSLKAETGEASAILATEETSAVGGVISQYRGKWRGKCGGRVKREIACVSIARGPRAKSFSKEGKQAMWLVGGKVVSQEAINRAILFPKNVIRVRVCVCRAAPSR